MVDDYHALVTGADIHAIGFVQTTAPISGTQPGQAFVDTSAGTGNWKLKIRKLDNSGYESVYDPAAVAITGGTINGTTIGATTPAVVTGTRLVTGSTLTNQAALAIAPTINASTDGNSIASLFATVNPTAALSLAYGFLAIPRIGGVSANNVTEVYGHFLRVDTVAGYTGNITNIMGMKIANVAKGGSGTLSTQFGLYIDDLTSGSNNYAIYTNAGIVRLGGSLAHAGSTVGFYNVTPASRPAAYTQTYSTASRTSSALTAATLTNTNGSGDTTIADVGSSFSQTTLNNNFRDLSNQVNALLVDLTNVKQNVTSLIDDGQIIGLLQ